MKAFWAIVNRDLRGYFLSPIFYAVATVFLLLTGLLFYSNLVVYTQISFSSMQNPYFSETLNLAADFIRPLAANFAVIFLFFIPAITMRSFSEEKRAGTLELMLTYPVSDFQVILGKFAAVLITMSFLLILTLIYPGLLFAWSTPEPALIASTYLGFLMMVSIFTAAGILASSATENQIIAALVAFGLNLVLWMAGWLSPQDGGLLHQILDHLSIINHFEPLIKGVVALTDLVYFFSMTIFFLFLTGQVLESKKWRG
ncbi:ABC transporter permease subunit [bacterium]|nr:ABC transporter permease subunit [candidate division CSSED10-310 bacterium]